jgi:hypothetical protein
VILAVEIMVFSLSPLLNKAQLFVQVQGNMVIRENLDTHTVEVRLSEGKIQDKIDGFFTIPFTARIFDYAQTDNGIAVMLGPW